MEVHRVILETKESATAFYSVALTIGNLLHLQFVTFFFIGQCIFGQGDQQKARGQKKEQNLSWKDTYYWRAGPGQCWEVAERSPQLHQLLVLKGIFLYPPHLQVAPSHSPGLL